MIYLLDHGECIIEVKDLTKKYGDLVAVDNITFCVKQGEIFGFLGPNGAGKTTTVRMLCGLTRITSGKASIAGYDVVKDSRKVKELIGVVPDTPNLYWELTCLENLLFAGEMYGIPRDLRLKRAEELLRFFGLWEKRNVKFKNLSRGLKKRLSIAAALIHNPRVLFMDEPTTGLDVMSKRLLWNRILELNKRYGITIFLTTHNVREAFEICDRIAIIVRGKITVMGKPWELRKMFGAEGVIEVSFYPSNPDVHEISKLPGVIRVDKRGDMLRIFTSDVRITLEKLAVYAALNKLDIYTLNLRGMDAEELFIRIVGDHGA